MSSTLMKYALVVFGAIGVWWIAAPAVVASADRRLKRRNKDHFRKMVRFYRAGGIAAVAVGVMVALVRV